MPGFFPLILLGGIVAAALSGLFGGAGSDALHAESLEAELTVDVPRVLRSGMYFEMRIQARARGDLTDAVVAIEPGLWRDITINTTVPQASDEKYQGGMLRMHYGALGAGERIVIKIDGQINPDLLGGTSGSVALFDGKKRLSDIPVTLTVLP